MTQPTIMCELLTLLEYFKLKKTLKAFKKEVGTINVAKTILAEDLINQILLCRDVFQRKDRKRKRKEESFLKNQVENILEPSKQPTLTCNAQNKENLLTTEESAQIPQKNKTRKLCKEDHVKSYKQSFKTFSETFQKNNFSQNHQIDLNRSSQQVENLSTLPSSSANEATPLTRLNVRKSLESITDSRLLDQSYASKKGDLFAAKAAKDLERVRGKDFRREMLKKKRSSWKGFGVIEDTINSIQFSSD